MRAGGRGVGPRARIPSPGRVPITMSNRPADPTSSAAADAATAQSRRSFLKAGAFGGLSLGTMAFAPVDQQVEFVSQKVSRASRPADLRITDMRYAQVGNTPIIRIYTNQDIVGHGDVRDGADPRFALFLKSRILGENPCNVEMLFKRIRQFGTQARGAGGVCAVEMALWDLAGKAYGVPVYQLLGGKYRDRVRVYVDTPMRPTPEEFEYRSDTNTQWLEVDDLRRMIE